MQEVIIRKATAKDADIILGFIKELAIYEKAEKEVVATVTDIKNNLFDINTTTKAIICTYKNKPIGFAVYFFNFSTWLGRNGLYLEDVYVFPDFRRMGIGKKLLKYLAQVAVKNNCARLELSVLDWNKPAIKFYESINAKAQSEWIGYRLEGDNLLNFAKDSS